MPQPEPSFESEWRNAVRTSEFLAAKERDRAFLEKRERFGRQKKTAEAGKNAQAPESAPDSP